MININPHRAKLYADIEKCFLHMIRNEAIEEVASIQDWNCKALGFKEIRDYLNGSCIFDEMVSRAQSATRQYAKRQYTWFKHQMKYDLILR